LRLSAYVSLHLPIESSLKGQGFRKIDSLEPKSDPHLCRKGAAVPSALTR